MLKFLKLLEKLEFQEKFFNRLNIFMLIFSIN